ncbi:MAG: aldo/keto reductase [Sandaracinaceae bacterium]|nr:aldo/keto reductase [Sandaracinaceae bacterium]
MQRRALGDTGLEVSVLGLGGGPLGEPALDERDARALVDRALERGVTLFDTARSYGESEARLGRALAPVRDRVVVSTKVGYGVEGHEDWTGPCVRAGVERALRVMGMERLDVVHLHSCPRHVLSREDVLGAIDDAVASGKVRAAAYSGEEEDLAAALETGRFGVVQRSVSPWDPNGVRAPIRGGVGVLAKRPLANACWHPLGPDASPDRVEYRRRYEALGLTRDDWPEVALRYAAFAPTVSAALVGTAKPAHLDAAIDAVARGPLPDALLAELAARADAVGRDWRGVI